MNAVIYARYSSHGQQEQSIEGQLRDNYAWAKQQDVTVIGEYIDRAMTGTKDQRPDFQRMIEDASKKQFQMVIVWKLDRFARNRYDSAIYKSRLKKFGVRVVSVKENITDSPEGIILEGLLESMAEYYSANLSQNIRRGQRESAANGTFCGGVVPYGYKSVDKKLVIDERYAPAVRYLFEQYAQGVPRTKIIDELNRRGYRTRAGKRFTINCLQHVLPNRTYIGECRYNGEVIPGLAQPMIDPELFERVQQRLKLNARAPAAAKARVDYQLRGKLFCGLCGAPMNGESGHSHTGAVHCYYACATRKRKGTTCAKRNERKDFLEWYVVEQTVSWVLDPARARVIAKSVVALYNREFSSTQIDDLEKAIARCDRDLNNLIDVMIDTPKAARPGIAQRMEAINAQKADLEADLSRLRIASNIQLTESEVLAWLHTYVKGDPTDLDFRRHIIDTFINSIYAYDDKIVIFYNVRGGKQVSYIDLQSHLTSEGSDLNAIGTPSDLKSEPVYVFIGNAFGCIYHRNKYDR